MSSPEIKKNSDTIKNKNGVYRYIDVMMLLVMTYKNPIDRSCDENCILTHEMSHQHLFQAFAFPY